jgi:hypothetical protein
MDVSRPAKERQWKTPLARHDRDRAQGLDSLDYLRQAARNARASNQKCLLDACVREATALLLR